jgi:hypothetical protein
MGPARLALQGCSGEENLDKNDDRTLKNARLGRSFADQ